MTYNPKPEGMISVRNSTNDNLKGVSVMGQFRAVFANAVRNFRSGAGGFVPGWPVGAIDSLPPFVLSFQLFEGEIPRILIFLSPSGIHRGEAELAKQVARVVCGEDCVNAG